MYQISVNLEKFEKKLKKINIKFEIEIYQCTLVPNLIQFGKLPFLGPNCPKNTLE